MNTKKMLIGAVLVIIGLPVVLVLIAAVSIYVLNRTNGTIASAGQKRSRLRATTILDSLDGLPQVICARAPITRKPMALAASARA